MLVVLPLLWVQARVSAYNSACWTIVAKGREPLQLHQRVLVLHIQHNIYHSQLLSENCEKSVLLKGVSAKGPEATYQW